MLVTKIFNFDDYNNRVANVEDAVSLINDFLSSHHIKKEDIIEYRTECGSYNHRDFVGNVTEYSAFTITLTYWK